MRGTSIGIALLVMACGGGNNDADAPPAGDDAPPMIDSRPNLPDAPMATCVPQTGTTIALEALPGLDGALDDSPMLVTSPPGDRRLFIVNRNGVIQIYVDGAMLATPFLDVNPQTNGGGEAGLLGLAFHPDFGNNQRFFIYYTTSAQVHQIVEYRASAANPNVADVATERPILEIPTQAGNHNGGMLEFGNDGLLYISVGDGGPQNDPENDAQNLNMLLGKILRIDINTSGGGREYGIPPTNPYAAGGGAPEVFMYGMRNPWRWSFDRATGDMYVGDVGQSAVEEITVIPPGQQNNADLGWRECEGELDHIGGTGCDTASNNRLPPQSSHVRPGGGGSSNFNAIIGGQVYRGDCFPDLVGLYFYSDNGAEELWSFRYAGGVATNDQEYGLTLPGDPASIHADAFGELYITTVTGAVRRIVAQ